MSWQALDERILDVHARLVSRGLVLAPEVDGLEAYLPLDRWLALDWLLSWIWPPLALRAEDVTELADIVVLVCGPCSEPDASFRHVAEMLSGSVDADVDGTLLDNS